jgi:hypothetical protein
MTEILDDSTWRTAVANTIEDYLALEPDAQHLPSVAKSLETAGYTVETIAPHALIKAERYAPIAAAFIVQTDALIVGEGQAATFSNELDRLQDYDDSTFTSDIQGLAELTQDIKHTFIETSWRLSYDKTSNYGVIFSQYEHYSRQDIAPTANTQSTFARSGGLADGVVSFFNTLQPAVDKYASLHPRVGKAALYHSLAPLGIARATHHLAAKPSASSLWDTIDPSQVKIHQRGTTYTALNDGRRLIKMQQLPDPETTDPIELERPRIKCPAHAHIPSRVGSALDRAFHASIQLVVDASLV